MAEFWIPDKSSGENESAVLPFGPGSRVDHILVISMLVLRSNSRPGSADSLRM